MMTLTPELLAELQAVDSDWRLIPCDGMKRPVNPATGEPQTNWAHHTYDADGIAELADSSFVRAVGLVLGEASGCIAVDFDGTGAVAHFRQVFGRPWTDLPATVAWSSGLPNRRQLAFRVSPDAWPHLRGRRVWRNDAGRTMLELRGSGHQSVITGAHPDTSGYRWIDGRSPAEQQVADAPDWLLEPLLKGAAEPAAADHEPSTDADVPRALELLAHIPPRDDYDTWLRVGMALHSVSAGLLSDWVNWSRGCSNFDQDECLAKWQSFKSSGTTIGTLHYLADTLGGFRYRRPPSEHAPPGKAPRGSAEAAAADPTEPPPATYRDLLATTLAAIREYDDDTEMEARAEIMARFRRTDGQINAALFRLLTEQEQRRTGTAPVERPTYRSIDLSRVVSLDWLLEGFLPANDQALLFAPAGAGKTTAALAMAFAVIDGTGFLDRESQPLPGSVLMIATDSGPAPLIRTLQDLGRAEHPALAALHDGPRLHVWAHEPDQAALGWDASLRGCLALLDFVQAHPIALVIIDSCKAATSRADLNYCDNGQVTALLTFVKEVICSHTSVLWLNHDGTAGGEAAGAKAWKEIPSIVHSIAPVIENEDDGFEGPPDKSAGKKRISTWRRTWAVRKCRQGTAREFNYQIDEDTGRLAVTAVTEVIRDVRHGVGLLLWQALQDGKASVHRREIIAQLGKAKGYSTGSVANSLTRASAGRRPMVARVGAMPGHWRLTPLARQWFEQHQGEPMPP
jgi:hypothetical protein